MEDTWLSLGRVNRIDFIGRLGTGGVGLIGGMVKEEGALPVQQGQQPSFYVSLPGT